MIALNEMSKADVEIELGSIRSRIRVLEWDRSKKQINPAKAAKLRDYVKREEELVKKLEVLIN